jgi:hypothetical protein
MLVSILRMSLSSKPERGIGKWQAEVGEAVGDVEAIIVDHRLDYFMESSWSKTALESQLREFQ